LLFHFVVLNFQSCIFDVLQKINLKSSFAVHAQRSSVAAADAAVIAFALYSHKSAISGR